MKPNPQEKQWLQEYLYQTMTYRESYEEIYDHILKAIENKPEQKFFESTVTNVIADDFGAYDTLHSMEENCRDLLEIKVKEQYWLNLYQWVKSPLIIYLPIIFICIYSIYLHSVLTSIVLFLFILVAPAIVIIIIGLTPGHTKASIKVPAFKKIIYKFIKSFFRYCGPISPAIAFIVITIGRNTSIFTFSHGIIIKCTFSIAVTFCVIRALSLFKTYKFNFNTSIIDNS